LEGITSRGRIDAAAGAIPSPSKGMDEYGVGVWTLLTCFLTFRLFRPFFPGEHSTNVAVKTSRAKRMKNISEEIKTWILRKEIASVSMVLFETGAVPSAAQLKKI
jgi:hypothetical protein